MGRPKLEIKSKRNNFTLNMGAQAIIDLLVTNKSKFVSEAIIYYEQQKDSIGRGGNLDIR